MSSTSIRTSPAAAPPGPPPRARARASVPFRLVQALASLRLTVALFALSLALVFFGTLAQIDAGTWTVVNNYFRWWYVWVPFQLLVQFGQVFFGLPRDLHVAGGFPFPGGWTVGGLLLVNLLAAHAVRFKVSWKRAGILTIHAGLVVLLLGEFVTGLFAVEGMMVIDEGSSSNFVNDLRRTELAIVRPNARDPKKEDVTVVPVDYLRKGGRVALPAEIPFDVEVLRYMDNSDLHDVDRSDPEKAKEEAAPATAGAGLEVRATEAAEVAGTSTKQTAEMASAYVRLIGKEDDRDLGTYLVSVHFSQGPQGVRVGGKTYDLTLRPKRTYKPFSLELREFRFDRYRGTDIAKNYSSLVRLRDPERGEDREVLIRMNEPLWHRGETFYQHSFDQTPLKKTTKLQVVRNPGWAMPYVSCVLVALGMVVHFGMHLSGFLRRRAA